MTKAYLNLVCFFLLGMLHLEVMGQCGLAQVTGNQTPCKYSTQTLYAANPTPGAIYTWTMAPGVTVLQDNGSSITCYYPNSGNFFCSMNQHCVNVGSTTTNFVVYVNQGRSPSGTGAGWIITGPDTVVAGVSTNYDFYWNHVPIGPGTNYAYILRYNSPTSWNASIVHSIFSTTATWHTDTRAINMPATDPTGKIGIAVYPANACSDTCYRSITVLGALVGPAVNCSGDIVTYNLPTGTVSNWIVQGGTILSGQGTNTVTVQWNTVGTDSILCTWSHANWGTRTTRRGITVGTMGSPTITGNAVLCNNSQNYTVTNQAGHSYRWTVNGVNRSFTNTLNLTASNDPSYTIVLTDSIGTCVATANMIVTNPVFPHPTLTAPTDACVGATISASVAAVPGATYTWNTGGGTILSGAGTNAITFRYSTWQSGPLLSVQVNVGGCIRSQSQTINLNSVPQPDLGPDFSFCPGPPLSVQNLNSQFGYNYSSNTGPTSGTYIYPPGAGTYWLEVSANFGMVTCALRDSVVITQGPSAAPDLGPDVSICTPTVTLSPTMPVPGPYTYSWSTGATSASVTVGPGTYMVTVTAPGVCDDADTIVVTAGSGPTVTISPPTQTVCPGASATFTANSGMSSYLWSTGATTQGITVTTPGTYSVTATLSGCSNSASATLSHHTAPATILGPDATVCAGPTNLSSAAFSSYLWNTGATTQTITVNAPGSYSVTVTDANGCNWADTLVLSHFPAPATILGPDATVCPGPTNLSSATFSSYLWNTGATTQTITVNAAGSYSVTVTDANGCNWADTLVLSHYPAPVTILGPDVAICPDTFATLVSASFNSYLWNTNATTQSIQASNPGNYSIAVMDAQGCTWNDTLLLSIIPDCVWPGDANHDGLADNQDILYMGLAMGATGASRAGATTSWYGQTCTNWGQVFPNSADYKHADADGNGTVMFADTAIVVQNYGLTHNKGTGVTGGVPLQFVPLQTSYSAGDTLRIGIDLGDVGNPAMNTNGISYSVMVSGISTSPGDVWLEFPQGLLGSNGVDMVALGIEDVAPGRHDVGQSRVGASPVTGFGRIAVLNIATDTIMLPNANNSVVLDFGNSTLVDPTMTPIALASAPLTLNVTGGSVGIDPIGSSSISLYPVPADGMVHLHAPGHHGISAVRIYDLTGKECMALNLENETLSIPVVDLPQGSYLLGLTTQGGDRQWKRFSVIHGR